MIMWYVIKQGGLGSGGLNFDAKVRRESSDLEDMFIAHIGGMDAYAKGLRAAAAIVEDGVLDGMIAQRYSTFDSPLGQKLEAGNGTFEEFQAYAKAQGEPNKISGKQELCENIFSEYV
jgi:xylose isomerase